VGAHLSISIFPSSFREGGRNIRYQICVGREWGVGENQFLIIEVAN